MDEIDTLINFFKQEVVFYKDKNNDDWSDEKNAGFKAGVKYSLDALIRIKQQTSD